jgi:predicted Ser/Thr protein kinase
VTTPNDPTMSHSSLDAVIAAYMLAVEAGEVPNRQELLDEHPDHTEALQAFFIDLDRMDRVASPLRLADGLDATSEVEANGNAMLATIRYFGDYELLEEIAHGGMGVVFKARQVPLNRVVALKMILQGTFATEKHVGRFRAEAEAAANLDHPHIVPIYEVGEYEKQQYYAMKFVEGTSLAKLVRSDPRKEVEGLLPVIRAVHHAHQRGILHRDLKPSNVLVDGHGTCFVTDFGLAKRLADVDSSFTETGQVLGTPRYMAPEQADGQKDLTVAADVYSLGVILYERLTGQTPFTGENALTLLRRARELDPPRPSSIRPGLDRDLETVVLKCLEKEPARRYSSAEALADDLDRWFRGEPIEARPVGRLQRLWFWVRRNPALAAAEGMAAVGLVAAWIFLSAFALQSQARAKAERERRQIAEQARRDSDTARDRLEATAARSLVRALNSDGQRVLSESEAAAMWELAESSDEHLRMRFLDEATRDPLTARQLRVRSEPAMIAAVGLDLKLRDVASGILDHRLQELAIANRASRADVALAALEIEDRPQATALKIAGILSEAFLADQTRSSLLVLRKHLYYAAGRLEPNAVARILTGHLMHYPSDRWLSEDQGFESPGNFTAEGDLVLLESLERVADRINRTEATRIADIFSGALARQTNAPDREGLVAGLVCIASRLAPADRAQLCARTSRTLEMSFNPETKNTNWYLLAQSLVHLTTRMETPLAVKVLTAARDRQDQFLTRQILTEGLISLASRLTPTEATVLCDQVGQMLSADLEREKLENARVATAVSLAKLTAGMSPEAASRVRGPAAAVLAQYIVKNQMGYGILLQRHSKTLGLLHVTAQMKPGEVENVCGAVFNDLKTALDKADFDRERLSLTQELVCILLRLRPDQAAIELRLAVHSRTLGGPRGSAHLWNGLDEELGPADLSRAAQLIGTALDTEKDGNVRWCLAAGIAKVAVQLPSADATRICGVHLPDLATALAQKGDVSSSTLNPVISLAKGLQALSNTDPARVSQAARILAAALTSPETELSQRPDIADGLAAIAAHVQVRDGADIAHSLVAAMAHGGNASAIAGIAESQASLAESMTLADAVKTSEIVAGRLIDGDDDYFRLRMARVFPRLTRRLTADVGPNLLRRTARTIASAVGLTNERRDFLISSFKCLTSSMEPVDADRICKDVMASRLKLVGVDDKPIFELLSEVNPIVARNLALELSRQLFSDNKFEASSSSSLELDNLKTILADVRRTRPVPKADNRTNGFENALSKPLPCRLTPHELVELLKMPTCNGEARQLVLDHLGNRYGRRFFNHWEFVRYAHEQNLGLDFTTPPRRPDPKHSLERMLQILDDPADGK